jgi:hypothetical protein
MEDGRWKMEKPDAEIRKFATKISIGQVRRYRV